jgi:CheY-like chemotaxis protein
MDTTARPKILLADDADVGRAILRSLLRKDFDVLEARNGLEAIRALESSDGGLAAVVLDVMMPVMDGFRVLRFMREKELIGRIPAIMLTAISDTDAKVRCYEAGATDVVEKPYDEKLIVQKIRALVSVFSARAAEAAAGDEAGAFADGLLDALPDAVYATDPGTHRITFCNAAFRDLPGAPADPVGSDIRACMPEAFVNAATEVWEDLVLRRVRSERFFGLPGDRRVWRLSYNALLDDAGEISDLVGHVSDVSLFFRAAPSLAATLIPEQQQENRP